MNNPLLGCLVIACRIFYHATPESICFGPWRTTWIPREHPMVKLLFGPLSASGQVKLHFGTNQAGFPKLNPTRLVPNHPSKLHLRRFPSISQLMIPMNPEQTLVLVRMFPNSLLNRISASTIHDYSVPYPSLVPKTTVHVPPPKINAPVPKLVYAVPSSHACPIDQ